MSKLRNRQRQRLPYYDYSQAGVYFVTACVKGRECVLGEVVEEEVQLSEAGKVVQEVWSNLPKHYSHVELDKFVAMPNHFHGIIWIRGDESISVGAGFKPAPTKRHGLPEIIRGLKTFSSRRINKQQGTQGQAFWQRGYYEHIIRDDEDLNNHRQYILDNPTKWALDEYYLEAVPHG